MSRSVASVDNAIAATSAPTTTVFSVTVCRAEAGHPRRHASPSLRPAEEPASASVAPLVPAADAPAAHRARFQDLPFDPPEMPEGELIALAGTPHLVADQGVERSRSLGTRTTLAVWQ